MRYNAARHRGYGTERVYNLPDGRRLVTEYERPAKVIDPDGAELIPSPAELSALLVIATTFKHNAMLG